MNVCFITLILAKTIFFQPVTINAEHIVMFSSSKLHPCILNSSPEAKDRGGSTVTLSNSVVLCVQEYNYEIQDKLLGCYIGD